MDDNELRSFPKWQSYFKLRDTVETIVQCLNTINFHITWTVAEPTEKELRRDSGPGELSVTGVAGTESDYELCFNYVLYTSEQRVKVWATGKPKREKSYWYFHSDAPESSTFDIDRPASHVATQVNNRLVIPYLQAYRKMLTDLDEWRTGEKWADDYIARISSIDGVSIDDRRKDRINNSPEPKFSVRYKNTQWQFDFSFSFERVSSVRLVGFFDWSAKDVETVFKALASEESACKERPKTQESPAVPARQTAGAETPGHTLIEIFTGRQAAKKYNSFVIDDAAISIH